MNAKIYVHRFAASLVAALGLVAGCKKQETPAPPTAPDASESAIVSAEKNSFAEVTSKLDPGGNLYAYLSTEQLLNGLSTNIASASNIISALPNIPGTGRQNMEKVLTVLSEVVKESGVSEISGFGMSSIAREPGFYYTKVVAYHYPGQDAGALWSLFGRAPHPLNVVDMLPESTALASSSDFDLPLLWTNIMQAARSLDLPEVNSVLDQLPAKFSQATGLDLDATLRSLGGEFGVIVTLDQTKKVTLPLGNNPIEIPNPGICLVFKVNSDLIFDRVDKILNANPILGKMVMKTDEPDLKMRTVPLPLPLPIEVHPSLARVGDYLLLATSDSMVREIVAVRSGKKKGFKTTEAFKRLSQGVPEDGNNFSLATSVLASTMKQVQEMAIARQNLDPDALKAYDQFLGSGTNSGTYSVGANGPDGWLGVGNGGSQGGKVLLVPTVAVVGLLSAIAIPNFVKARATSQQNGCINDLRLIDSAKQQWALENHKQNTDVPTMEDLQVYLGGANAKFPVCPAGGKYTIGSVGEKPACSIAGHELP